MTRLTRIQVGTRKNGLHPQDRKRKDLGNSQMWQQEEKTGDQDGQHHEEAEPSTASRGRLHGQVGGIT